MKMYKEINDKNRRLLHSLQFLVIFACFLDFALFVAEQSKDIGMLESVPGFLRIWFRGIVMGLMCVISYRFGGGLVKKYGHILVPLGLLGSAFLDAAGHISIFSYKTEARILISSLTILGLSVYFFKYCRNSVIHTCVFWLLSFVTVEVFGSNYITFIVLTMTAIIFFSSVKNKLIRKKTVLIIYIICWLLLLGMAVKITAAGIAGFRDTLYDKSFITVYMHRALKGLRLYGTSPTLNFVCPDGYIELFMIFATLGTVFGTIAFVLLTRFVYLVCRKCLRLVLTDASPIAYATVSIILVRYILSMLINSGIVLNGMITPIPVISDKMSACVLMGILMGLLLGHERVDIHSKRYGFAGGLSNFTKREFVFDGVECKSIEGVLQSFKCKDIEEQKRICALWGQDAKNKGAEYEWKNEQLLYWNGAEYPRESKEYESLISRLYKTVYDCDEAFRKDLEASTEYELEHSIGARDKKETVLTKREFITALRKLRAEAFETWELRICPIKQLYRELLEDKPDRKTIAILITTEEVKHTSLDLLDAYHKVEAMDTELANGAYSFSYDDGIGVMDFLDKESDFERLYVCCDMGESRSTAMAAAILRSYGESDKEIWRNPHYHPNLLVYKEQMKAFGMKVSGLKLFYLKKVSERAFAKEVKKARKN